MIDYIVADIMNKIHYHNFAPPEVARSDYFLCTLILLQLPYKKISTFRYTILKKMVQKFITKGTLILTLLGCLRVCLKNLNSFKF